MKKNILLFGSVVAMILAALAISSPAATKLAFPTSYPPQDVLQKNYVLLKHDLSPLPAYHFKMLVAKGWKTIKVKFDSVKEENNIYEFALFQKRDRNNDPEVDLSISVAKIPKLATQPAQWLESWVKRTFSDKSLSIRQKKVLTSAAGQQIADILFTYKYEGKVYASRIYSFLSNGEMFIIQGTAPENIYNNFAPNFFLAFTSFDLINR